MAKRFRKDLLIICIVSLVISAATILNYNLRVGNDKLPQQIIRFSLTLLLAIFVLLNRVAAKWIMGILFLLGGLFSLISAISLLARTNFLSWSLLLVMGLFYFLSGLYILITMND